MMKTYMAKPGEVKPQWYLVDAGGKILGRMATRVARILMGKHKPQYTPHVDVGDFVVVINASRLRFTGKKLAQKEFTTYSGYPGGLRIRPLSWMMDHYPDRLVRNAVRRMIPHTALGKRMLRKLNVYAGLEHPHQAQAPQPLEI